VRALLALGVLDQRGDPVAVLAGGDEGWKDMRGMYVLPGVEDGPPTVVWISAGALHQALLDPVAPEAPSPSASAAPSTGASTPPSTGPSAAP